MDDVTAAILAVVVAASVIAVIVTADKRGLRRPPKAPKTFNKRAFETALRTPGRAWFHNKLRLSYCTLCGDPNTKNPVIKRVALTMLYLFKGGTMDQAATALDISRPRSTLDVLSVMAKSMISMPPAEELAAVEDGFYSTAGFPDTIGAVDGTRVRIAHPHGFEGWYCRKNFHEVIVQAIVDHRSLFWSISFRSGSNNDQSRWNGSGVKKRVRLRAFKKPLPRITGQTGAEDVRSYLRSFLGCAVLHNMLTLMRDGLPIHGKDPLLQDVHATVSEDPVEKSKRFVTNKELQNVMT
ncbi:hypothetical protein PHMEG_0002547 [Phytophthora megakarya]|uniref:DDE Tnp4 domain-containing protein n=1 Tax=Phytophthora megakarya TaxID=4795 RepID=A0A225WY45_9STRA|nr:hypothetical protein PHMEG_0002547 [Phytophthora megakarya]